MTAVPQEELAQKAILLVDNHTWVVIVVPDAVLMPPILLKNCCSPCGVVIPIAESSTVIGAAPAAAVALNVLMSRIGTSCSYGGPNPLVTFVVQLPTPPMKRISPAAGFRSVALCVQPVKSTLLSQIVAVVGLLDNCIPRFVPASIVSGIASNPIANNAEKRS